MGKGDRSLKMSRRKSWRRRQAREERRAEGKLGPSGRSEDL